MAMQQNGLTFVFITQIIFLIHYKIKENALFFGFFYNRNLLALGILLKEIDKNAFCSFKNAVEHILKRLYLITFEIKSPVNDKGTQ